MNILNDREYQIYILKYCALAFVPPFLLAVLFGASLDEIIIAFTACLLFSAWVLLHEINQRDENSSAALIEILINECKSRTNIDKIK